MNIVLLGKVVKLHGYKGQMKVATKFDKDFDIVAIKTIYDKNEDSYEVERIFKVPDGVAIGLKNVDLEKAKTFINQSLFIDREVLKGKILFEDIKGSNVFADEKNIGKVVDVQDYGSAEVIYVKRDDGRELLFPNVDNVIENFDFENKKLTLNVAKLKEVSDYED